MEIKVNDYVRIKKGRIGKVKSIKDDNRFKFEKYTLDIKYWNGNIRCSEEQIIKSSPNIIDLIEVGDYVNKQLVKHIAYFEGVEEPVKKLIFADEYHLIPTEVCEENEIKSVLTKEMFEQIEYKID